MTTISNGFALALAPENAEQAMEAAKWISKSELVPAAFRNKPHDIVIAAAMGHRLGLDPFSSLAGIAVVSGRATLYGDAMLAVCQYRKDWGGMAVEWDGKGDDLECRVTVRRLPDAEYASTFGVSDAKTAKLWGKQGPWTQYPRRMLELRARAFALRGAFADALLGLHSREEMEDAEPIQAEAVSVRIDLANPAPAIEREIPADDVKTTGPIDAPDAPDETEPEPATVTLADVKQASDDAIEILGSTGIAAYVLGPVAASIGCTKFSDCPPDRRGALIQAIKDAAADAATRLPEIEEEVAIRAAAKAAEQEGGAA